MTVSTTPGVALAALRGEYQSRRQAHTTTAPYLRVRVHRHGRSMIDLSDAVVDFRQDDALGSAPWSSWVLVLTLQADDTFQLLDAIEDDDWVEVHASLQGGASESLVPLQVGPVDSVRALMRVTPEGAETWDLTVAGRGWMKALTDTIVTTLQRLDDRPGFTGAVLTPMQMSQLINGLVGANGALTPGTRPGDVMQRVVDFVLRGQWAMPATLAGPPRVPPVVFPFADAVASPLDVDGVAWRGVTLLGGIRGSVWQLLQQTFSSDPGLVELWPGWQLLGTKPESLGAVINYRSRPFSAEAFAKVPVTRIGLSRVSSLDLGKSGAERFNLWAVAPAVGGQDAEALLWSQDNGLPLTDDESIGIHGIRSWIMSDSLCPAGLATGKSAGESMLERARRLTDFQTDAYLDAPVFLNGTVGTAGVAVPPTAVGSRFEILGSTGRIVLEAYCEGMTTAFSVRPKGQRTLQQSFTLTRGRRLV